MDFNLFFPLKHFLLLFLAFRIVSLCTHYVLYVCVFAGNARKMRLEIIVVCSGNGHNIPPWHVHLFGHRKRSTVVVASLYI